MLGLGIMGAPVARNILNAGYELIVWNRSPDKAKPLAEAGAALAATPREAAEAAELTLTMVSDPAAALDVAAGSPDAAIHGLGPGKAYIDLSTVDPETTIQIGEMVRGTGAGFLEAPVSGSKKPAEDAQLILLCGGDRDVYDRCAELFPKIGKASYFLGDTGAGARMKLIVNMIMGSMMAAFGEGMALAGRNGLDLSTLLEVLDSGAMQNPMFRIKGPNVIKGQYQPNFPLKHMQKDMRLALALGDSGALPLPVAGAANALFIRARGMDLGDEDFAAVCKAVAE